MIERDRGRISKQREAAADGYFTAEFMLRADAHIVGEGSAPSFFYEWHSSVPHTAPTWLRELRPRKGRE